MKTETLYSPLTLPCEKKLVLLVLDGLGDIATRSTNWRTPLEAARTPNLDALARESAMGRMTPVAPGITPGSGPGHLGLFGYDPLEFEVGRGVIEALGLDIELKAGDVAARANFCTLDTKGIVTDRRAGRIDTSVCEKQVEMLRKKVKTIGDVEVILKAGKAHRFVVVLRGKGLEGPLTNSDPGREGQPIAAVKPVKKSPKTAKAAKVFAEFYKQALPVLKDCRPANGFLLRGIAHQPRIPTFIERYNLRAAAIATYPMYRGLAQLVGMTKIPCGETLESEFQTVAKEWANYDYFFVHVKYTDMYGEDGNFDKKLATIEQVDGLLPSLLALKPDVLAVTGDHSTPVPIKGHSWHPQPVLLWSEVCGADKLDRFTETNANRGSLGVFDAKYLIRLMQANARQFDKFGA
jgi:2,3-bisphosphoglycerate-independent phosphoglycerate mutase